MMALGVSNIVLPTDTFSGGSWLTALPLSNLADRDLSFVARSSDDSQASTTILIDHGSAKAARVLQIVGHNLSSSATIRWDRGSTSGGTEVVSGTPQNVWAFTPLSYDGVQYQTSPVVQASQTSARYEKITINDEYNEDGYIQLGYLWISTIWQPTYDMTYGIKDGIIDLSVKDRSDGGNLWVTRKRRLRTVSFALPRLSLTEGAQLHDFQVSLGITEPILYLPNITSAEEMQRFGMIGTLEEMSPIDYPYYANRSVGLTITELA